MDTKKFATPVYDLSNRKNKSLIMKLFNHLFDSNSYVMKPRYIQIKKEDVKGDYPYTVDINQIKEGGGKKMVAYPRLYISAQTHERIRKIALKNKTDMKKIGDKIARAGIKALGM